MAQWKFTIEASDLVDIEGLDKFTQLAERIKASVPYKRAVRLRDNDSDGDNYWAHEEFIDNVDELSEVQDEDHAEYVMHSIYDYCDEQRIWLNTMGPVKA